MAPTVLIVDDEPAQSELLRYNISKAGFDTLLARDGHEAILMTEEH